MAKKYIFVIGALFALSLFLRIWRLESVPVSLFGDEIDVGLQAYSIATTGSDYFGNRLPVLFHSFSEFRLPMQLYLDAGFIQIFGLNALGVRLPAFLMGVVSIAAFFFLVRHFFGQKVAIISSLIMAFSPWHFIFSRQANDAGIVLPFVLLGTLFFVKGIKSYWFLVLSAIFFSLGIYAYAIASLFIPFFVLLLSLLFRKKIFAWRFKKLFLVLVVSLLILAPYIKETLNGLTTQRFSHLTVSKAQETSDSEEKYQVLPGYLLKLFNSKGVLTVDKVLRNYLQALSPQFLFSEGDPNLRQSVGGYGVFYHFEALLIFLGLWAVVSGYSSYPVAKKKLLGVVLIWLLISPIASALTRDGGNHASRLILVLPPLVILSAFGLLKLLELTKGRLGKVILGLFILFALFDITRFFYSYFTLWPRESWRLWQYGFKEAVGYVKKNEGDYERVFLNNTYEPILPRFLFWYGYDMKLFQEEFRDDKHIGDIYPGFNGFRLGEKFYFGELKKPIEPLAEPGNLVVASKDKDATNPEIFNKPDIRLLDTVYSPTKEVIFYIYTHSE